MAVGYANARRCRRGGHDHGGDRAEPRGSSGWPAGVPFPCYEQYRDSFEDPDAQHGYDELYAQATYSEALEHVESTEEAHMDAGKVVVDRSSVLLAVWDGEPSRGLGGTADVVSYARQRGVPVEVIWPEGATR